MSLPNDSDSLRTALTQHLQLLYPSRNIAELTERVAEAALTPSDSRVEPAEPPEPPSATRPSAPHESLWSQRDSLLITYGDSVRREGEPPLQTLHRFLHDRLSGHISCVHVLPFCPFSSDDGFAVIDYLEVNPELGEWDDLHPIASEFRLMADLVINHASTESLWFRNFVDGTNPGADYFVTAEPDDDLSQVVRPRASPLLRPTVTSDGLRHVWCTFSHDQADLDFRNPDVLIEFIRIIRAYIDHGVRVFRLDAIGYLWKTSGTKCIHLAETHEVVRLIRTITDAVAPGTILITETNVPNHENLSYFGNRNEAHIIYNFSLAPLLVHALLTGRTEYLKRWMMSMPPAPVGCTYLNFTASHDGIGMRPAEGLLSEAEQLQLIRTIENFGGCVSTRRGADGAEHVYELNIALFDALKGTIDGPDEWQFERFICSQTVMMGLEGIPAFYIHSLLATPNDREAVSRTGRNRSVNRHRWNADQLEELLDDAESVNSRVLSELLRRLAIRSREPAFHPGATQFTLQLAAPFFAFWRQSSDRDQSIFAVHNMTDTRQELRLSDLNLISLDQWRDAISGRVFPDLTESLIVEPYQCLWIMNRCRY